MSVDDRDNDSERLSPVTPHGGEESATPAQNSQPGLPSGPRRGRRYLTRRNAVLVIVLAAIGTAALVLLGLLAYRLGYVDRYVAGQIKSTFANYGIRADIREFHTAITPQTVEMLGLELFDAQTGEKLGKFDRLLATGDAAGIEALLTRLKTAREGLA